MPKPRILIADDEEGIRESLRLILGQEYDLDLAEDGEEALSKLQQTNYALALLDIKMPKLDGLDLLRRVQDLQLKIPILIITAYQSVELAREAIKLGARDYLPKPFERQSLLTAVAGAITRPA